MGKPLVVLMDPDFDYIVSLESRFLEELGDGIDLRVVTDEDYRRAFFSTPHDIEALLIAEEWYSHDLDMQNVNHLFVLTENHEQPEGTCNLLADYTFKYSSLSLIFSKVVSSCGNLSQDGVDKETTVCLFYSPIGGSGKTSAALAVSICLQQAYKKVLYVDAEYLQSFRCFMRNGKEAPNEMTREMFRASDDVFAVMSNYIQSDGFDYLPPLRASLPAFGLEFNFFSRFIESTRNSGQYDYIIIDTDTSFGPEKLALFDLADRIIVLVTQDRKALFKITKLLDNLDGVNEEKYLFVCNKYRSELDNAFAESSNGSALMLDGFIEYDTMLVDMDSFRLSGVAGFRRLAQSLS